jgi:SAM-dependent methyltransferase
VNERNRGLSPEEIAQVREFFGPRAPTWEHPGADGADPHRWAVAQLGAPVGGVAVDLACGTGRALAALRAAVGPAGQVIALDITREMLAEIAVRGRAHLAVPVLADATALPLATRSVDAIFAAAWLPRRPGVVAQLAELARVTRAGGRLALFRASGRAEVARRRNRSLSPEDVGDPVQISAALVAAGWHCDSIQDEAHRYLVLATRE